MVNAFEDIITSFHSSRLPNLTRRDISFPDFGDTVRKAFVLIGMRRSGKTSILFQIMNDLLEGGLDFSKILYINFEDDRIFSMAKDNFQDIIKAYFTLYPEYRNRSDVYFFFDEVHEVEGWEKFIRRLLDQEKMKIYITGSSSKLLSKEIASSLRGRTISREVFPFSFKEMLRHKDISLPKKIGGASKDLLLNQTKFFLTYGGFPEVINQSPENHRIILQEYINSVLYRDVIERYNLRNTQALKHLIKHCLRNSATLLSINKIYNMLKSLQYNVSKNLLYNYKVYFQDAYCFFSVPSFAYSERKSSTSINKIYAVDQGLITAVTLDRRFDLAAQLETTVFSYLRRLTEDIYYYRTAHNREVDFLCIFPDQTMHMYQVSLSLEQPDTREREIAALTEAMNELNFAHGTIITYDDIEETIEDNEGNTIDIVPIWKILLTGPQQPF